MQTNQRARRVARDRAKVQTIVVLVLFGFFPFGLWLMWKWGAFNWTRRVVITLFFVLVGLGGLVLSPERGRWPEASPSTPQLVYSDGLLSRGPATEPEPKVNSSTPLSTLERKVLLAAARLLWASENADVPEHLLFGRVARSFGLTLDEVRELYVQHQEVVYEGLSRGDEYR